MAVTWLTCCSACCTHCQLRDALLSMLLSTACSSRSCLIFVSEPPTIHVPSSRARVRKCVNALFVTLLDLQPLVYALFDGISLLAAIFQNSLLHMDLSFCWGLLNIVLLGIEMLGIELPAIYLHYLQHVVANTVIVYLVASSKRVDCYAFAKARTYCIQFCCQRVRTSCGSNAGGPTYCSL